MRVNRWIELAVVFLILTPPLRGADNEYSVQWGPLIGESLFFLGTEHTFRIATDPGVRNGLKGSFVGGYINSLENIHGWADGRSFLRQLHRSSHAGIDFRGYLDS